MSEQLDLDHFRALLKARLAELRGLIAGARDQVKPVELDQSSVSRLSRMDAMQVQAMAQETERRRNLDLRKVETALERLDGGDYGFCLRCD
jgi:DnaK suppressor protein